jgi:hypothetical protein
MCNGGRTEAYFMDPYFDTLKAQYDALLSPSQAAQAFDAWVDVEIYL